MEPTCSECKKIWRYQTDGTLFPMVQLLFKQMFETTLLSPPLMMFINKCLCFTTKTALDITEQWKMVIMMVINKSTSFSIHTTEID